MTEETKEFPDWTSYDNWLIENNSKYSVTSLNEVDGKIVAVFFDKTVEVQSEGEKSSN